jgi:hypothetical protein
MSYTRCEQPPDSSLAIRTPRFGRHGYGAQMSEHHHFWAAIEERTPPDDIEHQLASAFHRELFASEAAGIPIMALLTEPALAEHYRRRGLGSLAVSMLIRNMMYEQEGAEAGFDDARTEGLATVMVDMMNGEDGMPLDHRVHVHHDFVDAAFGKTPASPTPLWYRQGDLYVKRQSPVVVTTPMLAIVEEQGIAVDAESMTTLTPYLASQANRIATNN